MTHRLMDYARTPIRVACTAYILMYFSEFLAWARLRPQDTPLALWNTFLVYCILAYVLLSLAHRMRAYSFWSVYLCGAVVGWICEGIMVRTMYMALPVTIVWSGLAWHALITVVIGWHRISLSLRNGSVPHILLLLCGCGLVYGVWAASWWAEQSGVRQHPSTFAVYSLVTGVMASLAYWIASGTSDHPFAPSRGASVTLGVILTIYALPTILAVPYAPLVIGPMLTITVKALRRLGSRNASEPTGNASPGRIPLGRAVCVLALPATGIITYTLLYALDLHWRSHGLMYAVTIPMAAVLYALSLRKAFKGGAAAPAADG